MSGVDKRRSKGKDEASLETTLGVQVGSDPSLMATEGKYDIRKHSNIGDILAYCAAYFRQLPDEEGGEFAKAYFDDLLYLSTSVNGWNVNKEIAMLGAGKGAPTVGDLMKKPNWFKRNVSDRTWRKKADEEGKNVVE